jgi:16S rRNA (uracil1498-N3)-methyltransferase
MPILRRFYVPRDAIKDKTAYLPPDEAHHLRDVLRVTPGTLVEIFDGEGNGYAGTVLIEDSGVSVRNLAALETGQNYPSLVLALALIKPAKFEWALEKATELGVREIIPLNTRRSDIRIPPGKVEPRRERWNRIVREASKQCRRLSAPSVRHPVDFADFLGCADFPGSDRVFFYENAAAMWRPEGGKPSNGILLTVGPEGGWERGEVEQAERAGFRICGLGPWILRAETAAVAAVSIIQYHVHFQEYSE